MHISFLSAYLESYPDAPDTGPKDLRFVGYSCLISAGVAIGLIVWAIRTWWWSTLRSCCKLSPYSRGATFSFFRILVC